MAKDVAIEIHQLIQRGLSHHEHGRLHDALSDWETALRLDGRNPQAKRLVDFAKRREAEIDAGEYTAPSRRSTIESPIPQFLAALTERKSDKITVESPSGPMAKNMAGPVAQSLIDDRATPEYDLGMVSAAWASRESGQVGLSGETKAPDTLEDFQIHAEDVRASANELLGECRSALNDNRPGPAALAAELALQLSERAPPPGVDDLVEPSRALFERAFRAFMGNPHTCPIRAIPTESIADHGLDQRAAFVMSRMDGMTSLADLIDSSGMSHFDAVRLIASLRRAKAVDLLPPLT